MGLKRKDETEKTRSRVFNVEETEVLIKEVRKHPCIYDSSLPDHKNESVKELARASIAQKFKDCTSNDVALRWRYLRDQFARKRKELSTYVPSGSSKDKRKEIKRSKKDFYFYDQLDFLQFHIRQRVRTDNLEKQLPLLNSSSDPISYLHETIEIDVRDTPVVKDPQGCTFSSVETNFVDLYVQDCDDDEPKPNDNTNRDLNSTEDEEVSITSPGSEESEDNLNATKLNEKESCTKSSSYKRNHGFKQPKKSRKQNSSPTDQDKHLDFAIIALSSLASSICSSLKKEEGSRVPVPEKSQELLECEEYCLNFAKKMASIPSELSRDRIRMEMEHLYFKYKHPSAQQE